LAEQDLGYRKIQLTGRDSYIISLPKEWVIDVGLKKGSQLTFKRLEDSSLLLVPKKVLEERENARLNLKEFAVRITPKDDPKSVARRIMSLYAISADIIHIRFKDSEITPEQKTSIKNTARMLLGSEIISESSNEISIQILINQLDFPLENAVRRMHAIAKSIDEEAVSALKDFNGRLAQDVIATDQDLDRLSLFAIRQLKYGIERNLFKEMGLKSPKEFLGYRIAVKNLENIGDSAAGTARNILALKRLIDEKILTLDKSVDEEVYSSVLKCHSFGHLLLEDSLKAFFKRDYYLADDTISRFISTGLQLEKDAVSLMLSKKLDPAISSVLRLILDNSKKMMEYGKDIAEVTLNRTVEEISTP
jgi:phosphate uptake regulator